MATLPTPVQQQHQGHCAWFFSVEVTNDCGNMVFNSSGISKFSEPVAAETAYIAVRDNMLTDFRKALPTYEGEPKICFKAFNHV